MLSQLKAYEIAVRFHRQNRALPVPSFLKDQWLRASSSIVLNIAEGYGKPTPRDKGRFYGIALGSLRECQAILDLCDEDQPDIRSEANYLGGLIYGLVRSSRSHEPIKRAS